MTTQRPPRSDRDLQAHVLAALNKDARLAPAEVGVEVAGGVVTLTGIVSRHEKVAIAAEIAVSVADVRDVANDLTVDGETHERSDTKIGQAIRHALGWNTAVPAEQIDTIIRRGAVTLRGIVEHWYQRRAAEEAVAGVAGVVSVVNDITLTAPPATDDILREEVEDALSHLPACEDVTVRVMSGVVTLAGAVGSDPLIQHAEEVAAAAPGVRSVVNGLRTR